MGMGVCPKLQSLHTTYLHRADDNPTADAEGTRSSVLQTHHGPEKVVSAQFSPAMDMSIQLKYLKCSGGLFLLSKYKFKDAKLLSGLAGGLHLAHFGELRALKRLKPSKMTHLGVFLGWRAVRWSMVLLFAQNLRLQRPPPPCVKETWRTCTSHNAERHGLLRYRTWSTCI